MKRLLLLLLWATPAVVRQYPARTDTAIIAYPAAVPVLGKAGSCYQDAAFNSGSYAPTICAVTDSATENGHDFGTTDFGNQNAWNANQTQFYFSGYGGALWTANFNPKTGVVSGLTKNGLGSGPSSAEYSWSNPSVAYALNTWPQIDVSTNGVTTVLHDARPDLTGYNVPYAADISTSYNDSRICFVAWTEQDDGEIFYCWNTATNGYSYINTQTWQVTAQWGYSGAVTNQTTQTLVPEYLHHTNISRDGNWAILGPSTTSQEVVWEIGTNKVWAFPATGNNSNGIGDGGHFATGYTAYYNSDATYNGQPWTPDFWISIVLGTFGPITPLTSTVMQGYGNYGSDYHISANNASGGSSMDANPPIVSTESVSQPVGVGLEPEALAPYMNEIDGLCTTCATPTVYRFAHTFDDYNDAGGACCGPVGNVSQNGGWFIFTSNWACTRGLDSNGNCRTDVFIVNLRGTRPSVPGEHP